MPYTVSMSVARCGFRLRITIAGVLAVLVLALVSVPVGATPFSWAPTPGIASWAPGTTINVVLPPNDPHNADVIAGIQRWNASAAAQGITINVFQGPPPAGTTNQVPVTYPATVPGGNDGSGSIQTAFTGQGADQRVDRGNANGGSIEIGSGVATGAFLQNLAMHEFGHVLGLADEASPPGGPHNVMDHNVSAEGVMAMSGRDTAEFNTVYNVPAVTIESWWETYENHYKYTYKCTHHGGSEIPLFQVHPDPTWGYFMPEGWDYEATGTLVSFFTTTNALSDTNPVGEFGFWSDAAPVQELAFACGSGFSWVVAPGVPAKIPEPSSILALTGGFVSLLALRRRRG